MMLSSSLYGFSQETFYYYRGKQEKLSTDKSTVAVVSSRDVIISLPPLSATRREIALGIVTTAMVSLMLIKFY